MNTYSPTRLLTAIKDCPGALDLARLHRGDWSHADAGNAAHEAMLAYAEGRDFAALTGELVAGVRRDPMNANKVAEGIDLARTWIEVRGIPMPGDDAWHEVTLAMDADWMPVATDSDDRRIRMRLDVLEVFEEPAGEESEPLKVGVVTDWKTSWADEDGVLDEWQFRLYAVAVRAHHPDVDVIRLRNGNLRRLWYYDREIVMDEDGHNLLDEWQRMATAMMDALDVKRPFRPGAHCEGCSLVRYCDAAKAVLDTPAKEIVRYGAAKATAAALETRLREAAADSPLEDADSGSWAGFVTANRKMVRDGASVRAVDAWWRSATGEPMPDATRVVLEGLFAATGEIGTSWLEKVAKRLHPGRDNKAERDALTEDLIELARSPRWKLKGI